ncbi:MAG: DUF5104 domain-containing protein [Hespellia sp.]|nr:DUF5104 domain-containing protein [Hespellia sp.]
MGEFLYSEWKHSYIIKKIILISMTVIFSSLSLSACGITSFGKGFIESRQLRAKIISRIDKSTAKKDTDLNPDEYTQAIMTDVEKQETDIIMMLFSEKVKSQIGVETLKKDIRSMEEQIKGEILSYSTFYDGGSGHRGGSGVTTRYYTVLIYTDMEIYEMSLTYVTENSTSEDEAENKASLGMERIVVLPVSNIYQEDGLYGENIREEYFDKAGAYAESPDKLAREVTYEGKSYTGYSIEYLQEKLFDSARRDGCESFMEQMDNTGFQGDIDNITEIHENTKSELQDEYEAGFNMMLEDSAGQEFLVETENSSDHREYLLRIADRDKNILYMSQEK